MIKTCLIPGAPAMCLLLCFVPGSDWVARILFLWSYLGNSYQRTVPTAASSQMSSVIWKRGKHCLSEGILLYLPPRWTFRKGLENICIWAVIPGRAERMQRGVAGNWGQPIKVLEKNRLMLCETEAQPHLDWGEYLEYAWEHPNGWAWPNRCISLTEESFHLLTFSHPSLSCVGQACSSSDRDNKEKKDAEGFLLEEFWGNPWEMEITFCVQSPSWSRRMLGGSVWYSWEWRWPGAEDVLSLVRRVKMERHGRCL